MTQTIQNGISTLENLFAITAFRIPQYQRAYSWEQDPHLETFVEDLRQQSRTQALLPGKRYFLGTFLLHEEDIGAGRSIVNIVDGQQRMTTAVVFIAAALALHKAGAINLTSKNPALLRRNFIHDDDAEAQKFRTIQEDEPFFRSTILGISAGNSPHDSPSARRLNAAYNYFTTHIAPGEWDSLINTLCTAQVMVYAVYSAEDATQIFELQNDRGKSLTSLEALKSFLMHSVYLYSPVQADDRLATLQTQFSTIFRIVESLAEVNRTPDEDQVLSNHCAAFLEWTDKEYNNPKHLIKSTIKQETVAGTNIIAWIEECVSSLVESYRTVAQLFSQRDKLPEFAELLVLGRMGSYWPLLLKAWHYDTAPEKENFRTTCRLLEVFAFRGYAVANLRSDTSLSSFYTTARDFRGDFPALFTFLSGMSHRYNLENRFMTGLDNCYFYQTERSDALYLLWRYENHLRGLRGQQQPQVSWRDFTDPQNNATKLSIEHVAARKNPIADAIVEWTEGEEQPFHEVALDRLGNLVVDSLSPNSSRGKLDFTDKLKSLSEQSTYLSQGELIGFTTNREVPLWDIEAIRRRHNHLITFARTTWNPSTWYNNNDEEPI